MPCPPRGFNATNYHLVVAEEAKLAVGKKYCYQKTSARGGVVYGKISKVCLSCPFRVHGFPCVSCVNRRFEWEIHGAVNLTSFCCVLHVTW